MIEDIRYINDVSAEFIQLSPFFIFGEVIEFQNCKFRCVYIFLEALKIDDEDKRQKFLEHYLDIENIKELFKIKKGKLNYNKMFNKEEIGEINFNRVSIKPKSLEFTNLLKNLILIVGANNLSFKYALFSVKNLTFTFNELDEFTTLKYLTAKDYATILKNM